ncbi:MAG: pyridoxamine 5-phosphate oxidase-related FMN-binding protein [Frankiales bacterium]|nr:pyridoxamine 5-phosphate oxidase-related FMN-binding protein [Frankiales bacterium]
MSSWQEFETDAPELASRVRERFSIRKHCTLATSRRDGSPRISGSEVELADGELRIGSMPDAVKAKDLLRDPRLALHSPTVDPPDGQPTAWEGEAKVAGRALPRESPDASHRFAVDITEVVLTRLDDAGTQLVITSWHPGRGVREIRRD